MTSEAASMKVCACSRCIRTTPSSAQFSEDDLQACTYVVNDCQGRGEALVELQTLNSTAAALHLGDWQGKIDLRASKQGCGPRFPSSVGAWIKFMSETTDANISAAKESEVNRWEIESQSHLSSFNNNISFANYLIVYAVTQPPSSPLNIQLKYSTFPILIAFLMMEAQSPSIFRGQSTDWTSKLPTTTFMDRWPVTVRLSGCGKLLRNVTETHLTVSKSQRHPLLKP